LHQREAWVSSTMSDLATNDCTNEKTNKVRNRVLVGLFTPIFLGTLYGLAFGSVVLNGTTSLPHNAYFMLRWPMVITSGSYVAFEARDVVGARFQAYSFVKRVVGVPGNTVQVSGNQVCVNEDCRTLQESLVEKGIEPISPMTLEAGQYLVFGDAPDSLDSRYALIGAIPHEKIEAVGFPIPFPHWKEIKAWFN